MGCVPSAFPTLSPNFVDFRRLRACCARCACCSATTITTRMASLPTLEMPSTAPRAKIVRLRAGHATAATPWRALSGQLQCWSGALLLVREWCYWRVMGEQC
jgi:hypothetical protein